MLSLVTSDIEQAIGHAQAIMVVLPSSAHADIAKAAARYLKDGQIVSLHPGRTLGALEFAKVIRDNGCTADVTVAEAETFIYASRKRYGVSVNGMESMIKIASVIHHTDYWRRGRTVERLELAQWSVSELTRYVQEGMVN